MLGMDTEEEVEFPSTEMNDMPTSEIEPRTPPTLSLSANSNDYTARSSTATTGDGETVYEPREEPNNIPTATTTTASRARPNSPGGTTETARLVEACVKLGMDRQEAIRSADTHLLRYLKVHGGPPEPSYQQQQRPYQQQQQVLALPSFSAPNHATRPTYVAASSVRAAPTSTATSWGGSPARSRQAPPVVYPQRTVSDIAPRSSAPAANTSIQQSALRFLDTLQERFDNTQQRLLRYNPVPSVASLISEIRQLQDTEIREAMFVAETWNAACLDDEDRHHLLQRTKQQSRMRATHNVIVILYRKQEHLVQRLQELLAERKKLTQTLERRFPCADRREDQYWHSKLQGLNDILHNEQQKQQFIWSCIVYPNAPALFQEANRMFDHSKNRSRTTAESYHHLVSR